MRTKSNTSTVGIITPPGYALPIKLTRLVTPGLAARLTENYARIDALNEAHKTMDDAATAMSMHKSSFIKWVDAVGMKWSNKKTYHIG